MWNQVDNCLVRQFKFIDFASALEFVNQIGQLAEQHNHHPDIELGWGKVVVRLTTHSQGGITTKDQQLAAAIDELTSA